MTYLSIIFTTPETSFDQLINVIDNYAVQGLTYIVDEYLNNLCDRFSTYITKNKLDYSDIHGRERFGMLAPVSQKDIQNGYYTIYRDGNDPKFAEYTFTDDELKISLYITKHNL